MVWLDSRYYFNIVPKLKNIVISFFSFSDIIRILNIYLLIVLCEICFPPLKFSINVVQKMENINFGVVFESVVGFDMGIRTQVFLACQVQDGRWQDKCLRR